jgi:hypothetical protein
VSEQVCTRLAKYDFLMVGVRCRLWLLDLYLQAKDVQIIIPQSFHFRAFNHH